MIIRPQIWKQELSSELDKVDDIFHDFEKEDVDVSYAKIEKLFYLTSFILRKLIEADHINKDRHELTLKMALRNKVPFDEKDKYNLEKHYAMPFQDAGILKLDIVCNLFIHSFIFFPILVFDDRYKSGKFLGAVRVNTDWTMKENIYELEFEEFKRVLKLIINEE